MKPAANFANASAAVLPSTQPAAIVNLFFEFSLLGMLTTGFLAVLTTGFLDWPAAAITGVALLVRFSLVTGWIRLDIPTRWSNAIAFAYLGFFPVDYYYLSGTFLSAVVHMIFFLAVLKLLTAKTARDFGYLKIIAALELMAAAILSTGLIFLLFLGIFLLFGIATFTSGEVRRVAGSRVVVSRHALRLFPRRLGILITCLFVGIVVLSGGLFFVLPRTARAALEHFVPQRYHIAGFSNSVMLGEIGEIKQSNAAVMHVRSFQEERVPSVKWRGAALSQFDGHRWFNPPLEEISVPVDRGVIALRSAVQGIRQGRNLIYQVRLEPPVADTLFFAGQPETIRIGVRRLTLGSGLALHVPAPFNGRVLDYSVRGFLPDEWAEVRFTSSPLAGRARQELLNLPPLDPRLPELARRMTAGAENDIEQSRAIERHLRQDFGYTLELLSKPVDDPLAHFLFERKKGHCEYFASAMAVMLRTLGIPSRVVTGFQSGVFNPITGWQVIRAADAHSWVEAWLDGRGWTTFDPTPYATQVAEPGFFQRLALIEDAASQYWQDWVVSYDLDRQKTLASRMQSSGRRLRLPDFGDLTSGLQSATRRFAAFAPTFAAIVVLLALGIFFGPALWKRWQQRARQGRLLQGQGKKTDATILYEEMLVALKRRGIQKPAWQTPVEFAAVLPASSELAPLVEDATRAYYDLRFGGKSEAAPRFARLIEQICRL